jgi:hypothetical protein
MSNSLSNPTEELIDLSCSGIYVLSFNMEKPMVYNQPYPLSDKLVDNSMIKVGKCKNIKDRMRAYRATYGYREKEPPKTEDYWISKGYESRFLRKCLGCEKTTEHDHVNYIHISPTEFVPEEDYYCFHDGIEKKISNKFSKFKIWSNMEYYQNEATERIVEEVTYLINNEKT